MDHILPASMGGTRTLDNTVVCCKTVNAYFGSLSPKQKLTVVLAWGGRLQYPHQRGAKSSAIRRPEPQ